MYIPLDQYDQFKDLASFGRDKVADVLIQAVRQLHEANDLEELILGALVDPNRTAHGPAEIVDIMTVNLSYRRRRGIGAFILKGRSFRRITPEHVSHQIFRLRRIPDLKYALLGHTGNLLDEARAEFIHTAEELGIHYTVLDVIDFARLAVVGSLLCPRDAKRLTGGRCTCGYRAVGGELNLLQKEALKQLSAMHDLGQHTGAVIMPTGSGKTRIAAFDAYQTGAQHILYVAHTHEILDGAHREFAHVFGAEHIAYGPKGELSIPLPVVVLSTIQSLGRNLAQLQRQSFDYVVVDEFHHAAARTYRRLLAQLKPDFLLALTATPFRSDRQDVLELCEHNVVVNFELRSGIDHGILVPYHYFGCFDDINYSQLKHFSSGYSIQDLNRVLIIPERDAAIIRKWQSEGADLPTLAFCCSRTHAKRMATAFREAGIPASEYLGETPLDVRAELIEKLQYGDIKILCAVDVLNEGVDIPFIECLLFLRPTESKRIFYQQLGRGLRRSPGKERVLVLDFIGNFHNAHRILDYLNLHPDETVTVESLGRLRSSKQVVNLPLGCQVEFDDRVIDIFARQVLDPSRATRYNIAQILIYLYLKTSKNLGRWATRKEVDRMQILHSDLYAMVFGGWSAFEAIIRSEPYGGLLGQ